MEAHRAATHNLYEWIRRAQRGELEAYDRIVERFQDMAVGYGYSLLRDFHSAQDAAQEAFIQAFIDLPALKDPRNFSGWFRNENRCESKIRRHAPRDADDDGGNDRCSTGSG